MMPASQHCHLCLSYIYESSTHITDTLHHTTLDVAATSLSYQYYTFHSTQLQHSVYTVTTDSGDLTTADSRLPHSYVPLSSIIVVEL